MAEHNGAQKETVAQPLKRFVGLCMDQTAIVDQPDAQAGNGKRNNGACAGVIAHRQLGDERGSEGDAAVDQYSGMGCGR